jgi:hypothetical protein
VLLKNGRIVLDAFWRDLSDSEIALLDTEVGLPIGYEIARACGIPAQSALHRCLTDPAALR